MRWLEHRYTEEHKPGTLRHAAEKENFRQDLGALFALLGLVVIAGAIILAFVLASVL